MLFKLLTLAGLCILFLGVFVASYFGIKVESLAIPLASFILIIGFNLAKPDLFQAVLSEENHFNALKRFFGQAPAAVNINVPPRRSKYFTGRLETLSRIREFLVKDSSVLLFGLGGVGKSQICLQYIHSNLKSYRTVVWLDLETPESFLSGLKVVSLNSGFSSPDEAGLPSACKLWLEQKTDWLLVLDNVSRFEDLAEVMPVGQRGHTIVTSARNFDLPFGREIKIDLLKPDEAVLLLLKRAGQFSNGVEEVSSIPDYKVALQLVEELGRLPLAIVQAGAYIDNSTQKLTMGAYLKLFKEQSAALLNMEGGHDHPKSIFSTMKLTMQKIAQEDATAISILKMTCMYDATDIPLEILFGNSQSNESLPASYLSAATLLEKWSLGSFKDEKFSTHRLLQSVVSMDLSESEKRQLSHQAIDVLRMVLSEFDERELLPEKRKRYQKYMQHLLSAIKVACEMRALSSNLNFCFDVAYKYLVAGFRYTEVFNLLEMQSGCGPFELDQEILLRERRGLNCLALMDFEGAEKFFLQNLQYEEKEDSNKARLLSTCVNLAETYRQWSSDDFQKLELADEYYDKALQVCEAMENKDGFTALAYNNIGSRAKEKGDLRKAEELYTKALKIKSPEPNVVYKTEVMSRTNLSTVYSLCDPPKLELAEKLLIETIELSERLYGAAHPMTAACNFNLAIVYRKALKVEDALRCMHLAIEQIEQAEGDPLMVKAQAQLEIARHYRDCGKRKEASALLDACSYSYSVSLSTSPIGAGEMLKQIATEYERLKNFEAALKIYRSILSARTQKLGKGYIDHIADLTNFSSCCEKLGLIVEAKSADELAESLHNQSL